MNCFNVISGPEWVLVIIGMLLLTVASESGTKNAEEHLYKINNAPLLRSSSCITADDLLVMQAKRHYEQIIPESPTTFEPLSDAVIMQRIDFFNQLENGTITAFNDSKTRELMLEAFADATGAYMYGYFVPVLKYSYYGGFVSHFAANEALRLVAKYQKLIGFSNSRWQLHELDPSHFFNQMKPINGEQHSGEINCRHLPQESLKTLIPTVEIDENTQELLLISIQYYGNGTVHNPKSKNAGRVLVNYYTDIARCFANKKQSLAAFQQEFTAWIANHTRYLLTEDTVLYPAFEGVLQIKKTVENERKLSKKAIPTIDHHWQDYVEGADSNELLDGKNTPASEPEMSTVQKISIWIGCSLAVLLVVYIVFKMQQNRKIITNNRYTRRRRKSSERARKLSGNDMGEEDELTLYDRLETDTKIDGSDRKAAKPQHKFSITRFMQRVRPRKWKSTAKEYSTVPTESRDVEADDQWLSNQQRNRKEDEPQPGTSGLNRKQRSRSCSCISCIERESCQDLDDSNRPLRTK